MYYYPHHIGDFISDTARLTDSQCMAYLRLIWSYYDTEQPLENDPESLAFKIGAAPSDVSLILKHYFVLTNGFWVNNRCEKVITEYHSKADKARNSANARWSNANALRAQSERNANESLLDANREPITNNQEPIDKDLKDVEQDKPAKKIKSELDYSVWHQQPDGQIFQDWLQMRKSKRAPISQTVLNTFGEQFKLAATFGYSVDDCLKAAISSSWTGFKCSWLQNQNSRGNNNASTSQPKSAIERFMQQHYPDQGAGSENDNGFMGGNDGPVRGQVDTILRGTGGQDRSMAIDAEWSQQAADSSGFERD